MKRWDRALKVVEGNKKGNPVSEVIIGLLSIGEHKYKDLFLQVVY
jgi:hypothetical protein